MSNEPANPLLQAEGFFQAKRRFKDRFAKHAIAGGGLAVIAAILLIFLYLLYEIVPLFQSASAELKHEYTVNDVDSAAVYLAIEEQTEISFRVLENGRAEFRRVNDGTLLLQEELLSGEAVTAFAVSAEESRVFAVASSAGDVLVAKHDYQSKYSGAGRQIIPSLERPFGEEALSIASEHSVDALAIRSDDSALTLAAQTSDGQVHVVSVEREQNFMTEEWEVEESRFVFDGVEPGAKKLLLSEDQRYLFALHAPAKLSVYDLRNEDSGSALVSQTNLAVESEVTDIRFLLGSISLLVSERGGLVTQWFWQSFDGERRLERIREFASPMGDAMLLAEQRRKGFVILNEDGSLQLAHTTSSAIGLSQKGGLGGLPAAAAISPRANVLMLQDESGRTKVWAIDNPHPEVSFSALWEEVWYESYAEPEYVWQSSASSNDFEPKYSFSPLAFGTLKAAFYSMLLAAPLALCAAIYTAFFMAPSMRRKIKPLVELMEALPTVILGFLAGLWLAPFVEKHLPAFFAILLFMPPAILLVAYAFSRLPERIRNWMPPGSQAVVLIPVLIGLVWLAVAMSQPMELAFFGGDARRWLTNELGISFDQRNAMVVGVAMGFAVIPTIFSIAEDAVFSVPKHIANGSLALGATPWQTLLRVVMPTASPGIFSALMIGMGRAVGETMIVLMATGNTPIMDVNIFEGMRTLAANIAVEVPEAEVDSTHYRVLFLAAFVLFMFTFIVNTVAELVRQRLRERYGSL